MAGVLIPRFIVATVDAWDLAGTDAPPHVPSECSAFLSFEREWLVDLLSPLEAPSNPKAQHDTAAWG